MMLVYVDACVYLNIWKKEMGWKTTVNLFNKLEKVGAIVLFSGFLLRELQFVLSGKEFNNKRELFGHSLFRKVFGKGGLITKARELESGINFRISFFDIIHLLLAKENNAILVTLDKELIAVSKELSVVAVTPKELLEIIDFF